MHRGFMMDSSRMMNWSLMVYRSFVVHSCSMMHWRFFVLSLMTSLMMSELVMGLVSDRWVLSVMLGFGLFSCLVVSFLGLMLDNWDRHLMVVGVMVMALLLCSVMISCKVLRCLMVHCSCLMHDGRLVVRWLKCVLLVGHEFLKQWLGDFDIFDMAG